MLSLKLRQLISSKYLPFHSYCRAVANRKIRYARKHPELFQPK